MSQSPTWLPPGLPIQGKDRPEPRRGTAGGINAPARFPQQTPSSGYPARHRAGATVSHSGLTCARPRASTRLSAPHSPWKMGLERSLRPRVHAARSVPAGWSSVRQLRLWRLQALRSRQLFSSPSSRPLPDPAPPTCAPPAAPPCPRSHPTHRVPRLRPRPGPRSQPAHQRPAPPPPRS